VVGSSPAVNKEAQQHSRKKKKEEAKTRGEFLLRFLCPPDIQIQRYRRQK
jgi:hypothetical protein